MKNLDLANKYAADVGDLVPDQRVIPMDKVDALLAEHLAVNSSQAVIAFRLTHLDGSYELSFIEAKQRVAVCESLYTANPLNQELLDAVKSLREALTFYADKRSYDTDHDTSSDVSRRVILYKDQYEQNEWTIYAGKRAIESLASLSPNVIKLIGE